MCVAGEKIMKISPRSEFYGRFSVPGDKSVTHRAILLNGAACGKAEITGALLGEDCISTANCMRALGAQVEIHEDFVRVKGTQRFNDSRLYCGNSGTTMRLLMGLIAGRNAEVCLTGDESLSARPMERVAEPLRCLGARIATQNGKPPVTIFASRLHGADVQTQVASAQVKSAVLLAGLGADGVTTVTEPTRSRDHTERMLAAMGAEIVTEGNTVRIAPGQLTAADVAVPCDISSAAYFMALGALLGETVCLNVGVNPTRIGILQVFDRMNVRYSLENRRVVCGEPVADIHVFKSKLKAVELTREIMPSLIDELPLIAVLCAFAEGESRICGAEELRVKESDRIFSTAEMLNAMGGDCTPLQDGFFIRGRDRLDGGNIRSYKDHRIAMSGAVGLCASLRGGEIENAECVNISFPNFYEMLRSRQ